MLRSYQMLTSRLALNLPLPPAVLTLCENACKMQSNYLQTEVMVPKTSTSAAADAASIALKAFPFHDRTVESCGNMNE